MRRLMGLFFCGILISSGVFAQAPYQEIEFLVPLTPTPLPEITAGNFTGHGPADLVQAERFPLYVPGPAFETLFLNTNGLTAGSTSSGGFTFPWLNSVSIQKLAAGEFDGVTGLDVLAVTSSGKLLVFHNSGQSRGINGFAGVGAGIPNGATELFDLTNPNYPHHIPAFSQGLYRNLLVEDLDQNGCNDIVLTDVYRGIFIFWCSTTATYPTAPSYIPFMAELIDAKWSPTESALYILGVDLPPPPNTPPISRIYAYQFSGQATSNSVPQVVQLPSVQLGIGGKSTGLAIGHFDTDAILDFAVSGRSHPNNTSTGFIDFYAGSLGATAALPNAGSFNSLPVPVLLHSEVQGLRTADLNSDGHDEVLAIAAYGDDPTKGPAIIPSRIFGAWGPAAGMTTAQIIDWPVSGYFPILDESSVTGASAGAPDALAILNTDRDSNLELVVAGLSHYSQRVFQHNGIAILKSTAQRTLLEPFVEEYGSGMNLPRGPTRRFDISLSGNPKLGHSLIPTARDLSADTLVGFNFDFARANIHLPVFDGTTYQNVWIGALPGNTSNLYTTPSSPYNSLWNVDGPTLNIPSDPAFLGFNFMMQGLAFDTIDGHFYSSQGLELRVGQ